MTNTFNTPTAEVIDQEYLPKFLWPFVFPEYIANLSENTRKDFEKIFQMREDLEDSKKKKFVILNFISFLDSFIEFLALTDTDELFFYSPTHGIFLSGGEILVRRITRNFFPILSTHAINELIDKIRTLPGVYKEREILNKQNYLSMINGTFNLENLVLEHHDASHYITRTIPVEYNPKLDCPNINKFLSEVVSEENIPLIEEMIGYCLWPVYDIHRAFILLGSGRNGKSTLLNVIRAFLGERNVTSLSLHQICSRFGASQIHGKIANISNELPSKAITNTGVFKQITGGDYIWSDVKNNKKGIEFKNKAKLIFACNEIPPSEYDDTDAFYERWIIIDFPNVFRENADKNILSKLTTPDELSGLFNLAVRGLKRLLERGRFEETIDVEQKKKTYIMGSNTVKAFVYTQCVNGPGNWVIKDHLYRVYVSFCQTNKRDPVANNTFSRELKRWCQYLEPSRKMINGKREYIYKGINLVNDEKSGQVGQVGQVFPLLELEKKDQKVELVRAQLSHPSHPSQLAKLLDTAIKNSGEEGLTIIKAIELCKLMGFEEHQIIKFIDLELRAGKYFEPTEGVLRRP